MALVRSNNGALHLGMRCPWCGTPAVAAYTERLVRTRIRTPHGMRATEIVWECGAGHSWGSDGRPILPVPAMGQWSGYLAE